jgi:hypothetical protein
MTAKDKPAFLYEISRLAVVYSTVEVSDLVATVWFQVLEELEIAELQRGVTQFLRGTDDFPTPGKILALARPEVDESAGRITREWARIARENAERAKAEKAKESANA